MKLKLSLKRAYDPPESEDGERILVERLWPRGLTKDKADLDGWLKEIAPSAELRKWYGHVVERWPEFQKRYHAELGAPEKQALIQDLIARARKGRVTLIYAAKDTEHNSAVALKEFLGQNVR
jgi:uncharacterized protein YeaO (DUF488 family)